MPTYLYKNLNSGEIHEIKQSMRDEALTQHPETGEPIKRVVARPGIAFKGSGFYVNDSRGSEKGAAQKEGAKGSSPQAGASAEKAPAPAQGAAKSAAKSSD